MNNLFRGIQRISGNDIYCKGKQRWDPALANIAAPRTDIEINTDILFMNCTVSLHPKVVFVLMRTSAAEEICSA